MEQRNSKLRSVVAGVLLVAMLAAVPFALLYDGDGDAAVVLPDTAFLRFDGVRISLADDGGIQAFVDVYVQPHEDYQYTFMYTFFLQYNKELWQPSDHDTNRVSSDESEGAGQIEFFRYNEELFLLEDAYGNPYTPAISPIDVTTAVDVDAGSVSVADDMLYVEFALDRDELTPYFEDDSQYKVVSDYIVRGDGMGEFSTGTGEDATTEFDYFYYLNNADSNPLGIKLGTLSFRVADHRDTATTDIETDDREVLRKLTENWDGKVFAWYDNTEYDNSNRAPDINSPLEDDDITPPLYVNKDSTTTGGGGLIGGGTTVATYPWAIYCYEESDESLDASTQIYVVRTAKIPTDAAAVVEYDFGEELITAKPLLEDVTINAYQAYTYEGPDFVGNEVELAKYNLAIALQKYAPTIEASYVDSRVENFTLNWGAADETIGPLTYEHDFTIYQRVADDEAAGYIANPSALPDGVILRVDIIDGVETTTAWQDIETITNYDYNPKQGEYIGSQYLYYSAVVDGVPTTLRYPTPMEVHLTVTPVTVVRVTAEALERNYTQSEALGIENVDDMQLPDEIRLHTDIVSGAPSLFLEIGSELPVWQPTDLANVKNRDGENWYVDPADTTQGVNDGTYPFVIGNIVPGGADTSQERVASAVYASEIEAKYPWVSTDSHRYDIAATRTVLPDDSLVHTNYEVTYSGTTADDYQRITSGDYTDDNLTLTLNVERRNSANTGTTVFPQDGKTTGFKIRLPNGLLIDADILADASASSAQYNPDATPDNNPTAFNITVKPGKIGDGMGGTGESAAALAHREEIRRWINLGGYFEVAICENVTYTVGSDTTMFYVTDEEDQIWTEFYPVFVSARPNLYEENKEYNFIGLNADLINYAGMFSDTITLPKGEYRPVIVNTTDGTPNTLSAETESYGVMTTYDGLTGDQPGRVYTFSVESTTTTTPDTANGYAVNGVWDTQTPDSTMTAVLAAFNNAKITRYNSLGENDFAEMIYNAYGKVLNETKDTSLPSADDKRPYEPVIRVDDGNIENLPLESVRLIYEGDPAPNNIITSPSADGLHDNVTKVVFDNTTKGYTVRQSFTLTILNDGDTDIDGLYIDSLLDNLDVADADKEDNEYWRDGGGAHFEITDPPASFLPAGAKTTFTITYTFNLSVLKGPTDEGGEELFSYLDKLYIGSNVHGPGDLIDFDATFRVEDEEVNRVTVVVLPPFADLSTPDDPDDVFYLGEAGVIAGRIGDTMDYTYDSTMRVENSQVYIGAFPYEEYTVKAVVTNDPSTVVVDTGFKNAYGSAYSFEMPGHSITVYVIFEETTKSKLRPEEINVYAAEDNVTVADRDLRDLTRKTLWQKKFDEDKGETGVVNPYAKMQLGAADIDGYNASHDHYLVVLEEGEKFVQADALLRQVKALYTADMMKDGNVTYEALKELDAILGTNEYANQYINTDLENVDVLMKVYDPDDLAAIDPTAKTIDEKLGEVVYTSREKEQEDGDETDPTTPTDTTIGDDKVDYPNKNNGNPGNTEERTKHTSIVFAAPETGERRWLVITLTHGGEDADSTTDDVSRSYYIELVRRPSHSATMNYGNSPVGMVYNTDYTEAAEKATDDATAAAGTTVNVTADDIMQQALRLTRKTRNFSEHSAYDMTITYNSGGEKTVSVPVNLLPYAFTRAEGSVLSTEYNYNREAWIPYGMLYDPDSLTFTASYSIGKDGENTDTSTDYTITDAEGKEVTVEVLDEYDTYESYDDLDLDPYSLFIVIGKDFVDPGLAEIRDSSMREVEPERVTRYIEAAEFVSATTKDASDLAGKGFFELAAADPDSVKQGNIYLGTLDESDYITSEYWLATHKYEQALTEATSVVGGVYPIFTYTDPTTEAVEEYFYQESSGNYFWGNSPHSMIEEWKIPYLEPLYVDVDNTALAIRPGVYDLIYEFKDFDGTVTLQVIRKLVVLGPVGDATADGAVHTDDTAETSSATSDETRIETRVGDPLGYDYEGGFDGSNAFKFRTVDANNDRNVNNIDANEVRSALANIKQFYEPVHYKAGVTVPETTGEVGA